MRFERVLVAQVAVARSHRALLDLVVDAAQHAVRRHLPLTQPNQRLDLAGKPVAASENRQLAGQVVGLPTQRVAEQHRRLVVEVVAGRHRVVAALAGRGVEQVTLRKSARRAGHPAGHRSGGGDVEAMVVAQADLPQAQPTFVGEGAGVDAGVLAVLAYAEPDVEPVGFIAEAEQQIPDSEASPSLRTRRPGPARRERSSRSP